MGLEIRMDWRKDVLEVDGVRFEGGVFHTLGRAAVGAVYRVEDRGDGVLTLRKIEEASSDAVHPGWVG